MNPRITTQHVRTYECCAEPRVTPVYNILFFSIPVSCHAGQLIASEKKDTKGTFHVKACIACRGNISKKSFTIIFLYYIIVQDIPQKDFEKY